MWMRCYAAIERGLVFPPIGGLASHFKVAFKTLDLEANGLDILHKTIRITSVGNNIYPPSYSREIIWYGNSRSVFWQAIALESKTSKIIHYN